MSGVGSLWAPRSPKSCETNPPVSVPPKGNATGHGPNILTSTHLPDGETVRFNNGIPSRFFPKGIAQITSQLRSLIEALCLVQEGSFRKGILMMKVAKLLHRSPSLLITIILLPSCHSRHLGNTLKTSSSFPFLVPGASLRCYHKNSHRHIPN